MPQRSLVCFLESCSFVLWCNSRVSVLSTSSQATQFRSSKREAILELFRILCLRRLWCFRWQFSCPVTWPPFAISPPLLACCFSISLLDLLRRRSSVARHVFRCFSESFQSKRNHSRCPLLKMTRLQESPRRVPHEFHPTHFSFDLRI